MSISIVFTVSFLKHKKTRFVSGTRSLGAYSIFPILSQFVVLYIGYSNRNICITRETI